MLSNRLRAGVIVEGILSVAEVEEGAALLVTHGSGVYQLRVEY